MPDWRTRSRAMASQIVISAKKWVNQQLHGHQDWDIPHELIVICNEMLFELDELAQTCNEEATRQAADKYCEAWRVVFQYIDDSKKLTCDLLDEYDKETIESIKERGVILGLEGHELIDYYKYTRYIHVKNTIRDTRLIIRKYKKSCRQ
jgi:hypothetical protein